jgi:hypothetical protein
VLLRGAPNAFGAKGCGHNVLSQGLGLVNRCASQPIPASQQTQFVQADFVAPQGH